MKIGPANKTTPQIGDKPKAAEKTDRGLEKKEKSKTKEDQLNISSRARELQANNKTSKISAEFENDSEKKLNLIRLKISHGHYDKPQIKMKISEKLSVDKDILREYYKSVF